MDTAVSNFILSFYRRFTRSIKKPKYNPGRSFPQADPAGTSRKLCLFRRIPAVSSQDYDGTGRKYIRKMEAVFPPEFTVPEPLTSHRFQLPEKKRNVTISGRILMESPSYPKGNDRKQQRISPEIIGKHNVY